MELNFPKIITRKIKVVEKNFTYEKSFRIPFYIEIFFKKWGSVNPIRRLSQLLMIIFMKFHFILKKIKRGGGL